MFSLELIRIRGAVQGDQDFLWWLHRETMRTYIDLAHDWNDDAQREHFLYRFDPDSLNIVEFTQFPIGYVSIQRHEDHISLSGIEIAPEFQNRGIGTYLIENLLDASAHLGLPVRLAVFKVSPARRLYERLGFNYIGETTAYFLMNRSPIRRSFPRPDLLYLICRS